MSIATMTEEERRAHAARALDEFKRLISIVYAPLLRAITGKKTLKVEPAAKISATDGKTVWLMVPWVLGETREHDRLLCGKRDPLSFWMECPACAQRDSIDSTVFHESAHITSESFEEVEPERIRDLVRANCPFIDADALDLPAWYRGRRIFVQVAAGFIEPVYLPTITNVVEDIYVNRRLFEVRPGVEPSMKAHAVQVFERGFHQADGTHCSWADQPLDSQAIMGVYNLGGRLPHLNSNLDAKIDELVTPDKILGDLMESIPHKCDAYLRMDISLKVLARLRELGFCIPPSQQPQPEPQGEESDESEDEGAGDDESEEPEPKRGSGGGGSSKGVESSEDDEDAETEGQGGDEKSDEESDDEGDPTGSASEPGDEEPDNKDGDFEGEDDAGDEEGENEGSGSGQGEEADESYEGDEEEAGSDSGKTPEELDKEAAEELAKMAKQMFGHEEQEQEAGNYTEPEDGLVPMGDPQDQSVEHELDKAIRWQKFDAPPNGIHDFEEIEAKVDPDLNYHGTSPSQWPPIKFDPGLVTGETARLRTVFALNRKRRMSGSLTTGPKLDVPHLHRIGNDDFRIFGRNDRPDRRDWFVLVGLDDSGSTLTNGAARVIREMGLGIGEMLTGVGVKFAMYAHSGRYAKGASEVHVTHKVIKTPDEPWTSETKDRLQYVGREDTGNFDGHSLEQYRKITEARRETDKMILYVTDGAMPMSNYTEELEVLQRELVICRQRKINLFGVGYQTDSPKGHGMDTVVIESGQDLPGLIAGLRQRLEV